MQKIILAFGLLLFGLGAAHAQQTVGALYSGFNPENFGSVSTGSVNTITRFVQTNGSTEAIAIGVAVTGSGYSITGGTCQAGATLSPPSDQCTIQLTYAPLAPGAALGNLAISCAPVAVLGGITVNCDTSGTVATTNIALQGTAVGAATAPAALPSLGRIGLSLLALLMLGLAVFSMRRRDLR